LLTRLSNWLNGISEVVCCLFLLAMTAVVSLQVFCRYVLGAALPWSEEISRYLLVWITFLGGSIALKREAHMGMHTLVDRLSINSRGLVKFLILILIFGFLSLTTVKGFQLAVFNMAQNSPAMRMPMGVIYLAIPTGCLIMLIHVAEQLILLIRSRPTGDVGEN
jgi:C4-dicarboxylate transporter DctQ subunit